ncbi:TetR/AcrR family transcriptional regulator [Streptomyces omiyaensis]|uniref:TetR/AcrR family transcriptional regulator n=1 Tax=Streptomyces omiyaensis TaxID=68247 RepID=A0ABW7C4B4_9ACTN|nr:TetR/AcrR family transcriptional regulator [Streptomyces omiyaensis]GGY58627.1 TetR family transcriptional regulator [Streptomyces omiyaensis]
MAPDDQPAPPLRRRGARMRSAVLAATVDVLAEHGLAGTTVGAVARAAGVHETSVYRGWRTRENLILEALAEQLDAAVPLPDTGRVRDDLVTYFGALARLLATPQGEALLRLSAERDDTLPDHRLAYWSDRLDRGAVMVARAVERGELPPDTDPGLVIEALAGPLFTRALISGAPLDATLAPRLVDLVLGGASAPKPGA